eukprot:m.344167 g.344167  ORF g.344167 m.344167 type:complete len:820 (+) comp23914_c0_seq1:116-2575(+)
MFEAVYEIGLQRGVSLAAYQEAWRTVAAHMMQIGAVTSKLFYDNKTSTCIIHSRWPNVGLAKTSWPVSKDEFPDVALAAGQMLAWRREINLPLLNTVQVQSYLESKNISLIDVIESKKKNILVYMDEGTSDKKRAVQEMLNDCVDLSVCNVMVVDAEFIKNRKNWEDEARLVVIPGGKARPYYTSLGAVWKQEAVESGCMRELQSIGVGNDRLRKFVAAGGNYLGICAGAYYGAQTTVFEKNGPLEVLDVGALGFFPGAAEGPAYGLGKFDYDSLQGAEVAKVKSDVLNYGNVCSFFNGGCLFTGDFQKPEITKLLAYENILDKESQEDAVAMVECCVGKGKAVLSGVHFEVASRHVDTDIASDLKVDDKNRQMLFAEVLGRFNVPLADDIYSHLYAEQTSKLVTPSKDFKVPPHIVRKRFQVLESTQTYATEHVNDLQPGEWRVVTSNTQTGGIGTRGRQWSSPPGNLYSTFSTIIPNTNTHRLQNASHIAGLSIVRVLETFGIKAELKWVNDVLVGSKKIAGVLIQASQRNDETCELHVGIGMNIALSKEQCEALPQPVTSVRQELGKVVNVEHILGLLQDSLIQHMLCLLSDGYEPFQQQLNAVLAFKGTSIIFDTETAEQGIFRAEVVGLDTNGGLLLHRADEERRDVADSHISGRIIRGQELNFAIFKELKGKWQFTREIRGKDNNLIMSLKGHAIFSPTESSTELAYCEEAKSEDFTALRKYRYTLEENVIHVYFDDKYGESTGLFHRLDFQPESSTVNSNMATCDGVHKCSPDMYYSHYDFFHRNSFALKHVIKGPKKDHTIITIFNRDTPS